MRTKDRALLQLAAAHHHLVGRREIRQAKLTSREWAYRVRSGEWVAVAPTVWRHVATPETWELQVRAAARWLGKSAALAGRSAAAWWELDGFDRDVVEFVVPRERRSVGGVAVRLTREWAKKDLLRHKEVRLTSATRTIIDMAGHGVPASQLEKAIDSAIRLRLTSVPTLTKRMTELSKRGRRGIPTLRELMLDSGGESILERRFLKLIRGAGLPRPECQVRFKTRGAKVIRVDFLYPGENVVIEVSGRVGHASDADRAKDSRRRIDLQLAGFHVIEFTTSQVMDDPHYVIDSVIATLQLVTQNRQ